MKKEPKIFVIIVTYKGMRWYDKCFSSLRESTVPLQTVVVDNTPGDEDVTYIKAHYPEIHIIKTAENMGFGRANNLGMRYALDNRCDYELLSDAYFDTRKDIYPVKYVNAAAWLMPRKTLETIGGFCPLIHMYGEDDDYLHRVIYHGYKVGIVPTSRIVHDCGYKLGESAENSKRAQWDDIDTLLDINNTQSLSSLYRHFVWKRIISRLRRDKWHYEYYKHRCEILQKYKMQIEDCREAHKIKQANWL